MEQATCSRCGKTRPFAEFAKDRAKKTGRKSWCKACDAERCRRYYEQNREARRAISRERQRPAEPRKCSTCNDLATSQHHRYCDDCRAKALKRRQRRNYDRPRPNHRYWYGRDHQKLRAALKPYVETGRFLCARCFELIAADDEWHLDHTDDRTGYLGPSHAECNRVAALNTPVARESREQVLERRRRIADMRAAQRQREAATRAQRKREANVQHRAVAARRAEEALAMRRHGHKWQTIADLLGYANTSGPYLAVKCTLGIDPRSITRVP